MDEAITTVFGSVIKSVDSLSRDNNKNQVKPLLDRRVDRIRLYMVKNDKKIQKAKEIMKKFNEAERKIKHDRKRRMREEAEKALGVNDSNNSINRSVAISGIDSINQSHLSSSSLSKTHESVISSSSYKKSVEPSPAISSRQSSYRRNDNKIKSTKKQLTKEQEFEEGFKNFLANEFNAPYKEHQNNGGIFATDDDGMMQETMEEKRIIMEMYNKDNREKRLKQAHVKTALTKHPLVPRRNKNDNSKLKPGELPLLKDMRKNDNKKDVMPAKDLREKLFRHRIYLRGLKERLNEYRVIDQEAEKFDLHRRIQAYLAAKGKAHKNHTRNISKP